MLFYSCLHRGQPKGLELSVDEGGGCWEVAAIHRLSMFYMSRDYYGLAGDTGTLPGGVHCLTGDRYHYV